jgi:phage shock protein A
MFKGLIQMIRGKANEAGEAIEEANQITILTQDIRDAKSAVASATKELTGVMADEKMHERDVKRLVQETKDLSSKVELALEKGEEGLAMDIVERLTEREEELETAKQLHQQIANSAVSLKTKVSQYTTLIKKSESRIRVLSAQDKLNKTNTKLQGSLGASSNNLNDVADKLKKVSDNIERKSAQNDAVQELADQASGADLDAKMKAAGLGGGVSAADRLAQFKAKKAG